MLRNLYHPNTGFGTVKRLFRSSVALIWFPFGFWNASAMIFALGETTHMGRGATADTVSMWMAT